MSLYRIDSEANFKNYGEYRNKHVLIENEWDKNNGLERYIDPVWIERYKYEAQLISDICEANGYKKILELGSGPGQLGQFVLEKNKNYEYSYIDKPAAQVEFNRRNFLGKFHVKNLNNGFDISGLDTDYDFIIANDFLEHIANPSDVLYQSRNITKQKAGFMMSVPNWRMGHHFIYRGLFDFDNWVYFCQTHGWKVASVDGSSLKCHAFPKLSSEDLLPDDLINSWNWYFNCEKE